MAIRAQNQFEVLASAARTASINSADFTHTGFSGLRVWAKATDSAATPSVVFKIQGKSPQGDYFDILAATALTGTGTKTLVIHPDIAASANTIAQSKLPSTWRVVATAADSDSLTYDVQAEYLL